jgi:hemerythrin-like domain-containing protein
MSEAPPPAAPDFGDPLAVLLACHGDMLVQCQALQQLVVHLREHGFDTQARSTITQAVQFFAAAALQHHQDEEVDVFPILNRQSLKLADVVFRLRADHKRLHSLWEQLVADFKRGPQLAEDSEFAERVDAFCAAYRDHIRREEKDLFDMARHILSRAQLEEIGRAMARRRGLRR